MAAEPEVTSQVEAEARASRLRRDADLARLRAGGVRRQLTTTPEKRAEIRAALSG
ncbi:MAG: hypothetical protein ABWY93_18690 [Mycobacterium sp.]